MDVVGVLAVTFLFGGGTVVWVAHSPVGKALADRLRIDLNELQERVDFAERLLARPPGETTIQGQQ